ncbi:FAD-dependent oxidoreductase [Pseudomonas aeruginosa]|uniref:NAD(P)/FAD-dependent oxidoreductase n=1 Tax=Pseudomonas aeruginosa TaxID=287 RepID=UPI000F836432|nr:FAD-dependent oxidoreductase [Pseudomonas aeruginosa]MCY4797031.1 FAD-dependent oxidoreductase [Pseudomonas aeruginosa]MDZ5161812.1 FAD-dependent oxidoreductase [Pseudomonas aeruginosa]MDZ5173002.1 FAD-dependent oxidoreductase [Pseudomonas aeruginosa]MDZ5183896.1 FAD-dependent oxidoreductase [Pseudomonas aeruginosa]MDZ5189211.1 FAD-dependent oxidoreductase [Pseudomonas aeruginosa]
MINDIVIIGSGLAGATAARVLRGRGYNGNIHLIGSEDCLPYDRPSLSKDVLGGKIDAPPKLLEDRWYESENIDLHLGDRVLAIDPKERHVTLASGLTLNFDRLLLATGILPRELPMAGGHLQGVHKLRNLKDCGSLLATFKAGRSLVIIGGGLIGCEVASVARKAGLEVTILECADELLTRVLGRQVGAWCRGQLEAIGVRVELRTQVEIINGDQCVRSVMLSDGRELVADTVLLSIGGVPDDSLLRDVGILCERGVVVDACGKTSCEEIYAAGDVAAWPLKHGGRRSLETYINTQQQAETASLAMLGEYQPQPQIPTSWTEIAGQRIQMVGDIQGPGEHVWRGELASGQPAFVVRLLDGKALAAVAINASRDFTALNRIVASNIKVSPALLANPDFNVRELLKSGRQDV